MTKKRVSEKQKLYAAVDRFAEAMKCRLDKKRRVGFRGWRKPHEWNVPRRMLDKAIDTVTAGSKGVRPLDTVDIANFAMMIFLDAEETEAHD